MKISVKCFATLAKHDPEHPDAFEVPEDATVGGVMEMLGLAEEDVKIMFVNGKHENPQTALAEGDRVGLFPAVGGG